jgi:hypothetical protein
VAPSSPPSLADPSSFAADPSSPPSVPEGAVASSPPELEPLEVPNPLKPDEPPPAPEEDDVPVDASPEEPGLAALLPHAAAVVTNRPSAKIALLTRTYH